MCSLKIVCVLVVQLVITMAFPPPLPPVTDLPKEQWGALAERAKIRLEQLANEQGHQFTLIQINNAQEQLIAGHRYTIMGRFGTSSSQQIVCNLDLWKASSDGFEEYNLYCGENEYRWSLGQRADS